MTDETLRVLTGVVAAISGTQRPNQQAMVTDVAQALADRAVLLIQAGTGTGKSLGYLVPLVVAARHSGLRSVVSTATLALQRQLVGRDLPALAAALPDDSGLTYAVLKGRGNYLCRARLAGDGREEIELDLRVPSGGLEQQAARLRAWADETDSGDRDDYPHDVDPRVWRSMSATGRECVGAAKCAFAADCFSEHARRDAAQVDIIVTNHALLALDAMDDAPVLPDHDVLVVDEAHEFVSRATNAATSELSAAAVDRAMSMVRGLDVGDAALELLREAHDGLDRAVASLAGQPGRLKELPAALVDPLAAVRDAAQLAIGELPSGDAVDTARRHRATAALEELHEVAGRLIATRANDVAWVTGGSSPTLQVAPLSVGQVLAPYLLGHRAVVLTSATLTVGGDFAPLASDLGLTADDWRGIDVGSPFDHSQQGILYVAADLPRPGRDGPDDRILARISELVTAAGGRTLVLLSSWRAVERVAEALARDATISVPVLVQRRGDAVARLVAQFAADEASVLVGTMSLFQGVDVPGSACVCVIIDRIPFPRPDDPIVSARSEQVEAAGGNGFQAVSVPRAALLLAQGSGRLIRSAEDRGVVAVLDSRLATAGYGGLIRKSLPPFWPTTDAAVAKAALQRLAADADAAASSA
jgi:ATP-dependent DNA helicase DinG